jgi:hypothetical protein
VEDSTNKLRRITQQREADRQEAAKRYAQQSRERLRKNMETKIRTTMIGSLALVEQKFSSLWGQGKPRNQLTDAELAWETIKDELRTEILNNGNNQLRAAIAEINQYDVTWNRFQYEITEGHENE